MMSLGHYFVLNFHLQTEIFLFISFFLPSFLFAPGNHPQNQPDPLQLFSSPSLHFSLLPSYPSSLAREQPLLPPPPRCFQSFFLSWHLSSFSHLSPLRLHHYQHSSPSYHFLLLPLLHFLPALLPFPPPHCRYFPPFSFLYLHSSFLSYHHHLRLLLSCLSSSHPLLPEHSFRHLCPPPPWPWPPPPWSP